MFTCLLLTIGIGYLFALTYLYLVEIEPHNAEGHGLLQDVIEKYYGKRGDTQLEAALNGAMGDNISAAEKEQVFLWIKGGATEKDYAAVAPIFQENCAMCHNPDSGFPIPPLTSFEDVSVLTSMDMGQSVKGLVRVSHVHLFGMSFIFFMTGGIFALSEINVRWRCLLIATPFVAIWLDIGSWWFTKLEPIFAYTVIFGGFLMGISLFLQIVISLGEMWIWNGKGKDQGA